MDCCKYLCIYIYLNTFCLLHTFLLFLSTDDTFYKTFIPRDKDKRRKYLPGKNTDWIFLSTKIFVVEKFRLQKFSSTKNFVCENYRRGTRRKFCVVKVGNLFNLVVVVSWRLFFSEFTFLLAR